MIEHTLTARASFGCEVTVTKGAAPGQGGDRNPTCCCGRELTEIS
jgi:hypothetical protein